MKNLDRLVSIIVPIYNAENYIAECVKSLVNQSHNSIQIILVDDGSSDKSGEICENLALKDTRIKVIHQNNSGVSKARNQGVLAADGKYIAFSDADDTMPSDSISTLFSELTQNNVDAVFGNFNLLYNKKTLERKCRLKEGNYQCIEMRSRLLDDGTLSGLTLGSACGALYKADIIRGKFLQFCENIKINEDGIFNFQYCMASQSIRYIQKPVYNYRQWKSSKNPNIEQLIRLLSDATQILREICRVEALTMSEFDGQLKCRELFCIFQESMVASRLQWKKAKTALVQIWDNPNILLYSKELDYSAMGKYKRVIWSLIKNKRYCLYYVMMHYVYPFLKKCIKR